MNVYAKQKQTHRNKLVATRGEGGGTIRVMGLTNTNYCI